MSSHALAGLDLEDLTPRQLRQLLRGAARSSLMSSKKTKGERDEGEDEDHKENDDLVDLSEEKGGKPKTPKVTKDDLPKSLAQDKGGDKEEEDDEEEEIA
jgi:hypothetical protein